MDKYVIPAGTRIGHVHLKVSNLQRSLDFYCGLLGFELMVTYGDEAAFISAGGYHHHIGLNTWYSKDKLPRRYRRPGYSIRPSCIHSEKTWLWPSGGCSTSTILLPGLRIMVFPKPFILMTPTGMVSNCIGTGPVTNGRWMITAG